MRIVWTVNPVLIIAFKFSLARSLGLSIHSVHTYISIRYHGNAFPGLDHHQPLLNHLNPWTYARFQKPNSDSDSDPSPDPKTMDGPLVCGLSCYVRWMIKFRASSKASSVRSVSCKQDQLGPTNQIQYRAGVRVITVRCPPLFLFFFTAMYRYIGVYSTY